jgi:hypothetical protein
MKYMELLADDGTVVGVVAAEQPNYLRYVQRHDIFVGCTESEAQAVMIDNQICYLTGREGIRSVRDDILLNAVFIDKDEYDRLEYLATVEPEPVEQEAGESEPVEQTGTETVMTDLDVKVELLKLRAKDEATTRFFKTVMDPTTNSIAKIRAAAQQCIDYRNSLEEGVSNG